MQFVRRVGKIAGARPDHRPRRQAQFRRQFHQAEGRRQSAFGKRRAQFDAVGAVIDRRAQTRRRIDHDFEPQTGRVTGIGHYTLTVWFSPLLTP